MKGRQKRYDYKFYFIEEKLDDAVVAMLAKDPRFCHIFSFVERGGWYAADTFIAWMSDKLDSGMHNGVPRRFSKLTLAEIVAFLGQMRMIPDTVIIVVGVLPLVYFLFKTYPKLKADRIEESESVWERLGVDL